MKNPMIVTGEDEKIIKSFNDNNSRIVVTAKRVIIEGKEATFSILLEAIGGVGLIKNGSRYAIRLFSKDGNNLFAYEKNYAVGALKREDATAFENVLTVML